MTQNRGKTHVFLTGDRGSGKSWIVRQAAERTGRPCYGFLTRFAGGDRLASALYMVPPAEPGMTDEAHKVAERADGRIRPLPGRFDALGTALLTEARRHPEGLIAEGCRRPRAVWNLCRTRYVPVEESGMDPEIMKNINTPEEYAEAAPRL